MRGGNVWEAYGIEYEYFFANKENLAECTVEIRNRFIRSVVWWAVGFKVLIKGGIMADRLKLVYLVSDQTKRLLMWGFTVEMQILKQ